jgi:hypothetical protein
MTPYGDRRRAGEYQVGTVKTKRQDTIHDPETGGTAVQEMAPETVEPISDTPDPAELTLKELQAQADALGLPTYGTKADLADRIAGAS